LLISATEVHATDADILMVAAVFSVATGFSAVEVGFFFQECFCLEPQSSLIN